ncbi:Long-chain-fatty-acid--CoA ligase FadD15 [Synechococcus sp. MIT S9509]|uniref:AMP-binding protein n=1 Tax=unclassified Synechococcus TaxID=2626047 RepID=UPI0007BBABDC|nr:MULTISPECIES: AMP-binding protein [unclassified Synechococcus]KZR83243.1 Long-chain-fatty-acid--CoA ligase FadD15 [Synechococcus sp. MIT S9504]KZR88274.1 Long-chain-fatty-acid--CoA ligase FadD15 [Synechococcus sp. MIT S9509]
MTTAAKSTWYPTSREQAALARQAHVQSLGRVDQVWPWLKSHHGDVMAVDAPHAAHPERLSYQQLAERIDQAAAAFRSLQIGSGDVVGLFAENSPRWLVADQGLMRAGAIDAVRGAAAPVEELRYILEDSAAVALVVQTADLLQRLQLPADQQERLRFVLVLEGPAPAGALDFDVFLALGKGQGAPDPMTGRDRASAPATTATILYTSGTTGRPKGVPLTHANLLHQMRSLACVTRPEPGSPVLSVLPIWHSYERSAEYYFFSCACSQSYTTIKQLKKDLPRVKPVIMATVPRLWEAVQAGFEDAVKTFPASRQRLLRAALANSTAYTLARRRSRDLMIQPLRKRDRLRAAAEASRRWPAHALASKLIWPKLRQQLSGGELRYPINGGGAIAPHVDSFFEAVGIELLVGYGLTETSPVVSCRRPWRNIRGSSGLPLPETEFRVVDAETRKPLGFRERGVVLVRGPQVMAGYLGKPEATAKVLDADGWFDTGDLGMLLPDGSVVLTGRAKDTIVLSSGENIEPGPLEEALVSSPLIEQVMLVGQDERQLGALVVPRLEAIKAWASSQGCDPGDDLGGHPGDERLLKLLRGELNRLLADRVGSRADERLAGVALVEPFSIENGLLTQTLKQRRDRITDRDRSSIESVYGR